MGSARGHSPLIQLPFSTLEDIVVYSVAPPRWSGSTTPRTHSKTQMTRILEVGVLLIPLDF